MLTLEIVIGYNCDAIFYLRRPHMSDDLKFIRRPEVLQITGLRKSTLYHLMRSTTDPFPPNYPTSERGRAWIKSEVLSWCERRRKAERKMTPIEKATQNRASESPLISINCKSR